MLLLMCNLQGFAPRGSSLSAELLCAHVLAQVEARAINIAQIEPLLQILRALWHWSGAEWSGVTVVKVF